MSDFQNNRILIVDDNEAIHEDFKKVLLPKQDTAANDLQTLEDQLFGASARKPRSELSPVFELASAFKGEQALVLVESAAAIGKPYALIFMDVRMPPGWDGIETIRRIWERHPDTEIVLCTAYSDYTSDDIIDVLGVTDRLLLLKKPFDPTAVRQMALTLTKKWALGQKVRAQISELEGVVQVRTQELQKTVFDLDRSLNDLRSTQELLVQTSKMSALGEMSAGVAHEINNPLAIISTLAGQMRELVTDTDLDRGTLGEIAEKVENTAMRIARIVAALRSFCRVDSHDPFQSVPLRSIFTEVLELSHQRFRHASIDLRMPELSDELKIECRSTQIAQVILNLLNNAVDAVQGQAKKWIQVDIQDLSDQVRISVTDSGSGIPREIRQKIFQPFFTTKEIGKGTGLGLSIANGIIGSHQGKISLDPDCADTRFVIVLPKKQSESEGVA